MKKLTSEQVEDIFENLLDGFGNSCQSESNMLADWIRDCRDNERYDKKGKLDEESLDRLDSELSEIENTVDLIRHELRKQRQAAVRE